MKHPANQAAFDLIPTSGNVQVMLTGVHVSDYPNVSNPAAPGVGPALVLTSVTVTNAN